MVKLFDQKTAHAAAAAFVYTLVIYGAFYFLNVPNQPSAIWVAIFLLFLLLLKKK